MRGPFPEGTLLSWKGIPVGGLIDVMPGPGIVTVVLQVLTGDRGQAALAASLGLRDDVGEVIITLPAHAAPRLCWTFTGWVRSLGEQRVEDTVDTLCINFGVVGGVVENIVEAA